MVLWARDRLRRVLNYMYKIQVQTFIPPLPRIYVLCAVVCIQCTREVYPRLLVASICVMLAELR